MNNNYAGAGGGGGLGYGGEGGYDPRQESQFRRHPVASNNGSEAKTIIFMDFETIDLLPRVNGWDNRRLVCDYNKRICNDVTNFFKLEHPTKRVPQITELALVAVTRDTFKRHVAEMTCLESFDRLKAAVDIATNSVEAQVCPELISKEWEKYSALCEKLAEKIKLTPTVLRDKNKFREEWPIVLAFLKAQPKPAVIVAHNGAFFDFVILYSNLYRSRLLEPDMLLPEGVYFLDSIWAYKDIDSKNEQYIAEVTHAIDWSKVAQCVQTTTTTTEEEEEDEDDGQVVQDVMVNPPPPNRAATTTTTTTIRVTNVIRDSQAAIVVLQDHLGDDDRRHQVDDGPTASRPRSRDSFDSWDDDWNMSMRVPTGPCHHPEPAPKHRSDAVLVEETGRVTPPQAAQPPGKESPLKRRLFPPGDEEAPLPLKFMRKGNWSPAKKKRARELNYSKASDGSYRVIPRNTNRSYKLEALYQEIFKTKYNAHRARDDCMALLQLSMAYGTDFLAYVDARKERIELYHKSVSNYG